MINLPKRKVHCQIIFSIFFSMLLYPKLYSQLKEPHFAIETGTLSNVSNLSWTIAGNINGNSPNILSELKFTDVKSLGHYFQGNYSPLTYLNFSAYYNRNEVTSGKGSDIDYKEDNRKNSAFEKTFMSDDGSFISFSGGVGAPIRLSENITVTPSIFYSITRQKFYLKSDELEDLRSTYQVDMRGAEISIMGNFRLNKGLYTSLDLRYHFIDYSGEADWNQIAIFQHPLSFSQDSKGLGRQINWVLGANINRTFSVVVSGLLNNTDVWKGVDTAYLKNKKEISTQFNGAQNNLYSLRMGVRISI